MYNHLPIKKRYREEVALDLSVQKCYAMVSAGQPSSTAGLPSSTAGQPSLTASQPSSTAGLPSSTAGHPSSTAGLPSSTAGHPSSTAGLPSSTAGLPSSTAGQPFSSVSQPFPEVSQPFPEVSQPFPEVSQPFPEVSQPFPEGKKAGQRSARKRKANPDGGPANKGDKVYICVVCGQVCRGEASGYHYHVLSCEGCKGFFKRAIQAQKDNKTSFPPCKHGGNCVITPETRASCKACRLKKCFAVGMDPNSVKNRQQRDELNAKRARNRLQREKRANPLTEREQRLLNHAVAAYHATRATGNEPEEVPVTARQFEELLKTFPRIMDQDMRFCATFAFHLLQRVTSIQAMDKIIPIVCGKMNLLLAVWITFTYSRKDHSLRFNRYRLPEAEIRKLSEDTKALVSPFFGHLRKRVKIKNDDTILALLMAVQLFNDLHENVVGGEMENMTFEDLAVTALAALHKQVKKLTPTGQSHLGSLELLVNSAFVAHTSRIGDEGAFVMLREQLAKAAEK